MSFKIAIVGGGWLGCHLASKLKDKYNVTLYDREYLFSGSSSFNQNRLHKGFHYSRNQNTRRLCQDTFLSFVEDYGNLVDKVENNYYVVPQHKSIIDYATFKSIFAYDGIDYIESSTPFLSNIEGGMIVDERYINPLKAKLHFDNELKSLLIKREIKPDDLIKMSKENDLVINTTNNILQPITKHSYELCLTLLYKRTVDIGFGALTMVDGPFFSIYPYQDGIYTVTDVQHTPIYSSMNIEDIENYKRNVESTFVNNIKLKIEEKIKNYYVDFNKHFEYVSFFTSTKVKKISESADRSPTIIRDDNLITGITGKIQGIYTLENYIINEVINR